MQFLVILGVLIYIVGYSLVIIFSWTNKSYRSLISWVRTKRNQRVFERSFLGHIDKARKLAQAKIDEVSSGIEELTVNENRVREHLAYLEIQKNKDHSANLNAAIIREIEFRVCEAELISRYTKLFEKCRKPILKEKQELDVLYEMVKFDQNSSSVESYLPQFNALQERIYGYSSFDFSSISNEATYSLNSGYKKLIATAAAKHAGEMLKDEPSLSIPNHSLPSQELLQNDDYHSLEESIRAEFQHSINEFESLKRELQTIFD
jgi:hypothetical protein